MERLFLDSSAYVKIFSPEEGSQLIQKLLEAGQEGKVEIAVSAWTINETVAALDRKARRREITQQGRDKAIATLLHHTDELAMQGRLTLLPVTQRYVSDSIKHIVYGHLSADDALQLFSAIITSCTAFVSADDFLTKIARQEGLDAFNIGKEVDRQEINVRVGLE